MLTWTRINVLDAPAAYGHAGTGPVVVFLHGWALSDRTYRRSLERLAAQGYRVLAPALPGFGGSASLRDADLSLSGYAAWVAAFLEEVEVTEPVVLVGHSFGGAVAIKTAHDHPALVSKLVLVNSIGGTVWVDGKRTMAERPVWDWGVHLATDSLSIRGLSRVLPVVAGDAFRHALLRPGLLWRVGRLAREADLGAELDGLRRRALPVVIVWGKEDTVVPWACAQSLMVALGECEVVTTSGDHNWLIGDPGRFVEVLTNVLGLRSPGDDSAA